MGIFQMEKQTLVKLKTFCYCFVAVVVAVGWLFAFLNGDKFAHDL